MAACLLVLIAGFVRGQETTSTPAPTADQTLKILGASYNYGHESADVTETVKSLLRSQVSFSADPHWLGVDPHPYMNKELDIFCEIDGKFGSVSLDENADVSRDIILKQAHLVKPTTDATVAPHDPAAAEQESAYAADPAAFPSVSFPVNEQSAPGGIQIVRLNAHPDGPSGSVSGFRFRVDQTEAAERQHVADKTKMHLFWFFVNPRALESWYIVPVKGEMRGFSNFSPLKMDAFKNTDDLLPKDRRNLTIQRLAADRLQEGQEYIMWFDCKSDAPVPVEMSISLGYRLDDRDFDQWQDLAEVAKFLGLTPTGDKLGFDQRAY